jgi:hypothetical protein
MVTSYAPVNNQLALILGEEIMPALPDFFNVSLEVGN